MFVSVFAQMPVRNSVGISLQGALPETHRHVSEEVRLNLEPQTQVSHYSPLSPAPHIPILKKLRLYKHTYTVTNTSNKPY